MNLERRLIHVQCVFFYVVSCALLLVCFCDCVCVCVCVFVCVCVSVRLSVSLSSIWILLILFSSSNPSFSLSSLPGCGASLSLPPTLSLPSPPPPLLCFSPLSLSLRLLDRCCLHGKRSCIFRTAVIHLAAAPDKHVVVDRRLGPGPEEQDRGDDRLTWVGPALVPTSARATAGSASHLSRWSGVELSPLFIKRTRSLCLASPWPPASCHSGTREN